MGNVRRIFEFLSNHSCLCNQSTAVNHWKILGKIKKLKKTWNPHKGFEDWALKQFLILQKEKKLFLVNWDAHYKNGYVILNRSNSSYDKITHGKDTIKNHFSKRIGISGSNLIRCNMIVLETHSRPHFTSSAKCCNVW